MQCIHYIKWDALFNTYSSNSLSSSLSHSVRHAKPLKTIPISIPFSLTQLLVSAIMEKDKSSSFMNKVICLTRTFISDLDLPVNFYMAYIRMCIHMFSYANLISLGKVL